MKNLLNENGELIIEYVLGYRNIYTFELMELLDGYQIIIKTRSTNVKDIGFNNYEKKETEVFESEKDALNYVKAFILELKPKIKQKKITNDDLNF